MNGPSKRTIRNKRRDQQGVHRQPRRTGHEWRDEDRRDAIAFVLNGARRHDRRYRATVGREQRDEALALQSDARHGAVRDQRGARQVAGVFQDADEQEQEQHLRQEYEHAPNPPPDALNDQRLQQTIGQRSCHPVATELERLLCQLGDRGRRHEDRADDADHNQ